MHLAAADALAVDLDRFPGVIGEMARHWHAVGDLDRALTAWVRAGEAYTRMDAFSDAWTAYRNVLGLVEQVPNELDVVSLTLLAAEAADLASDTDAALPLLERVRATATSDSLRATAASRTGWILFRRGGGDAAHRAFQDALGLLPADETSVLAARVQAGLALLAVGWSRLDEADEAAAAALRIARAIGARREEGLALNAQGCVAALRGQLDLGVPLLREALTIAREGQDPQDLGAAYVNLSHLLGMAGLLGDAVELAKVGIVELTRVGQERQQGSLLLHNVSEQLVEAGRYVEARELVDEALARHPRGIQAAPVLRTAARIAMTSGDLTAAWEHCEQARLVVEAEDAPVAWLREVLETTAEVELWAGRPDAAYDVVLDGLELVAGTDDEAFAMALVALGVRALADAAAVHRDHRARTLRESQRRRLLAAIEAVRRHPGAGGQPSDEALDLWVRAELARLDSPRDVAPTAEAWTASADAWADLSRPFRAAYARWREAEARLAGGVNAESLTALRAAHAAALALGAAKLVEEVEALATWYRADLLPTVVERPEGDPLAAYQLTEREREVLLALAAGHSNREIAEELFISVKTASVHVSNILRKLDVPGRQDAARIAHRLGVGPDPALTPAPDPAPDPGPPARWRVARRSEVTSSCPARASLRSFLLAASRLTHSGEVEPMDVAVLAGSVSTALFVGSYLPMLLKAFRTKNLDSYSRGNLVLATVGNAVYSIYVFSLPFGPIWFLHTFYVVATLLMLVWHLRHVPPAGRLADNATGHGDQDRTSPWGSRRLRAAMHARWSSSSLDGHAFVPPRHRTRRTTLARAHSSARPRSTSRTSEGRSRCPGLCPGRSLGPSSTRSGSTHMLQPYRCLCGQPLAAFVVPPAPLPVGDGYVRAAVADALAAHLERLEARGSPDRDVHGVVSDVHGGGLPWILDGTGVRAPSPSAAVNRSAG